MAVWLRVRTVDDLQLAKLDSLPDLGDELRVVLFPVFKGTRLDFKRGLVVREGVDSPEQVLSQPAWYISAELPERALVKSLLAPAAHRYRTAVIAFGKVQPHLFFPVGCHVFISAVLQDLSYLGRGGGSSHLLQ